MLVVVRSVAFRRDLKQAARRGKDVERLRAVLALLVEGKSLPRHYRDHPLKGDWRGYRDLHIERDWLLIYRVVGDELQLARTGSHADIFRE